MNSILMVCHPVIAASLERRGKITIRWHESCGPLGLRTYSVLARREDVSHLAAERYRVVLPNAVVDNYNLEHLQQMFSAFLTKVIRAEPLGYDVVRFHDPMMTHIYPMYGDDYLYAGENERKLLFFDPLASVGFVPLFLDRRCWNYMKVDKPVLWGGSAILHSADLLNSEEDIEETRRQMDYARRLLLRGTIPDIEEGS